MSYVAKRPFTAKPEDVIGLVHFTNAMYRNKPVEGTFALIKGYQDGGNGEGFITIREPGGKRSRVTVFKDKGFTLDLKEQPAGDAQPKRRSRKAKQSEAA